MLIAFAIHRTRMAIAASPAPRNTALICERRGTLVHCSLRRFVQPNRDRSRIELGRRPLVVQASRPASRLAAARFRLRAKRCGVTTTKLDERSRVGEARRSAKRGGGSRIVRNPPKGGRHGEIVSQTLKACTTPDFSGADQPRAPTVLFAIARTVV